MRRLKSSRSPTNLTWHRSYPRTQKQPNLGTGAISHACTQNARRILINGVPKPPKSGAFMIL